MTMDREVARRAVKRALRAGPYTRWLEDQGYVDDGTRPARKIRELAYRLDAGTYREDEEWVLSGVRDELERLARTYLGHRVRMPIYP